MSRTRARPAAKAMLYFHEIHLLLLRFHNNTRMMRAPTPSAVTATHEQQVLKLARTRKLLRARDVAQHGLPTIALTRLVQAGKLERVARGLYGLPGAKISAHRSLAEVSVRVPKAVICLLSALRVHEIGTQAPFEVWIAIPQRMVTPRLDQPAIRVVRMSDEALAGGIEHLNIDGVDVSVFSAARTVVDCFRFRNKIGLDVALEALRDGWSQRKFKMDELWRHATRGRVANVMRPYVEAITA
jgi:predicted transcriptional regulator of viral defense system